MEGRARCTLVRGGLNDRPNAVLRASIAAKTNYKKSTNFRRISIE